MRHPNFARGLEDKRAGLPFNYDIEDEYWAYERGRQFALCISSDKPLFINKKLNTQVVLICSRAFDKKILI